MSNGQEDRQQSHEKNDEILLVAEDLLSQCLICDQENFQILFLIALIHYELRRYDSALNYIRQAIQLSDDHMIKHYYLKANMKLFLGKYEQAIKDYSNAITVFKEFEKEKDDNQKPFSSGQKSLNKKTFGVFEENLSFESHLGLKNNTFPNQSNILTSRSQTSRQQENEYYEEEQEMHPEIYLNRAIAYLKHSYFLQYDTCHPNRRKNSQNKLESYHDVRENIINLKSAAGQDIKQYFTDVMTKLKLKSQTQVQRKHLKSESLHETIDKQPKSPNRKSEKSPKRSIINTSKSQNRQLKKAAQNLNLFLHTSDIEMMLQISKSFAKQFGCKLLSDEELMNYFYLAKELNNCLNLMDKIIKKYYLAERSQREENVKQNQLKKYSSSKVVEPAIENEPYFKSRKQYKMSRANNYSQFNVQKYNTKGMNNEKTLQQKQIELQRTRRQHERIQKLIIDKKILSALKDSSNNGKQDYENALVTLLQQEENISKGYSSRMQEQNYECGDIFKYSDLVFFIGVMYYLLEDFNRCIRYFEKSYQLKKQSHDLLSLRNAVSKTLISQDDDEDSPNQYQNGSGLSQMSISNLRAFEQIYDNRIYSKQEITYNIGVAYLMAGDYNSAYDFLEKYDSFVNVIENALTQINDGEKDSKRRHKNKLKKSKDLQKNNTEAQKNSFDQISVKTQSNKGEQQDEQLPDITPFPTHNRLCSIYPPKEINGFKFSISFCLPKMQLPYLGIFYSDEIQIGQSQKKTNENNLLDSLNDMEQQKQNDKTLQLLEPQSDEPIISSQNQGKFVVKKQNIVNFLDIVTLKDIAMKPIAPWIKKDKQKKCIRFTDNFLSESFDLMTECATERRLKNSSRKQMFGHHKDNQTSQIDHDQRARKKEVSHQRQDYQRKVQKKINEQNQNFTKVKQKQKPTNKRYETIEHE